MSQHFSTSAIHPGVWVEHAVFGFDRWLRQHQGVYEYSDDSLCMFRVQRGRADCDLSLNDGTRVREGDPVLNLHLWNEHIPAIGPTGISMNWAREMTRRVELSMYALTRHLKWTRDLDDIVAIRGDMRLGTAEQNGQLARVAAHYGFEPASSGPAVFGPGMLKLLAENVFICFLVLATNPAALRLPVLRRSHKLVYLSRAALETRYAPAAMLGCGRVRGART